MNRRTCWLPLSTQQLRLRNLVRIEGQYIECAGAGISDADAADALIYYTLHETKENVAFYTSEMLPRRHYQQKWAEINCPTVDKSNAKCVCVKVWARFIKTDRFANGNETEYEAKQVKTDGKEEKQNDDDSKETISALSRELSNAACLSPNRLPRPPDKLLFTWGVYFSGLMPLGHEIDHKFLPNTLTFQMNGEYFASPEQFSFESLRKQLSINYERYSASLPKVSMAPTLPDEYAINSPHVSRSSSPVTFDRQQDLLHISKTRYTQLLCKCSSVRKSYDLKKLLNLQELQRLQVHRKQESTEIITQIKQLSVRCITKEELSIKPRISKSLSSSYSHIRDHQSMGRTLSLLLSEQQRIDPHALLQAQQLQQQLEVLRSKQRFLQVERETYCKRITQLRQRLNKLSEVRQQMQALMHTHHTELQQDNEQLNASYQQQLTQLQTKRKIMRSAERRMSSLCIELSEIYPISRHQNRFYTICNIPFPNLDAYMNDARYASGVENISPMALSVSLGNIAHLVQMIAVILNRPLRNPIVYEGSRTRILDIIKDIPYGSREFPLYTRSSIPSKPVRYAIYLLNQNIAQLCYDITGTRCDLRATVENLMHIFEVLREIERNQGEIDSKTQTHPNNRLSVNHKSNSNNLTTGVDHIDGGSNAECANSMEYLSKSHSSNDMNHMAVPAMLTTSNLKLSSLLLQMPSSQVLPIVERNAEPQQRICRSVGSYSDSEDNFKDIINQCYSNSDSNIKFNSKNT